MVSIVLENAPDVNPFSMKETGPVAYHASYDAMKSMLNSGNSIEMISLNHYVCYVDCSLVSKDHNHYKDKIS